MLNSLNSNTVGSLCTLCTLQERVGTCDTPQAGTVRGLQVAIPGGGTTMIKAYLSDTYGYELHDIGRVVGTLVAFSAFFIFMAIVVLRTINFQKR